MHILTLLPAICLQLLTHASCVFKLAVVGLPLLGLAVVVLAVAELNQDIKMKFSNWDDLEFMKFVQRPFGIFELSPI